MTNPIRPAGPGAGPGLGALDDSAPHPHGAIGDGASAARGPEQAGSSAASQASHASQAAATQGAAGSSGPQAAAGSARVLAELRAGHIDRDQAIEALVGQALAEPHLARLSPAKQAELAAVLRASLRDDPRLGKLLGA